MKSQVLHTVVCHIFIYSYSYSYSYIPGEAGGSLITLGSERVEYNVFPAYQFDFEVFVEIGRHSSCCICMVFMCLQLFCYAVTVDQSLP